MLQSLQKSYEPIGCLSDSLCSDQEVSELQQKLHSVALAKWCGKEGFPGLKAIPFKSNGFSRSPISVGREILPNLKDSKEDERLDLALDLDNQDSSSFEDQQSMWDGLWSRRDLQEEIPAELQSIP